MIYLGRQYEFVLLENDSEIVNNAKRLSKDQLLQVPKKLFWFIYFGFNFFLLYVFFYFFIIIEKPKSRFDELRRLQTLACIRSNCAILTSTTLWLSGIYAEIYWPTKNKQNCFLFISCVDTNGESAPYNNNNEYISVIL